SSQVRADLGPRIDGRACNCSEILFARCRSAAEDGRRPVATPARQEARGGARLARAGRGPARTRRVPRRARVRRSGFRGPACVPSSKSLEARCQTHEGAAGTGLDGAERQTELLRDLALAATLPVGELERHSLLLGK